MKKLYVKICIYALVSVVFLPTDVFAARVYIEAPQGVSSNREPFPVTIFIDTEGVSIGGLSGDFSFSSELFDVKSVTSQNGVIPLWVTTPHVSLEKKFDQKTHIIFEGIIPGGFNGVHSLYGQGVYPGILFTAELIPKSEGKAVLTLDSIEVHAYNSEATTLTSSGDTKSIVVPPLLGASKVEKSTRYVLPEGVQITIASSSLVNNNTPYLIISEENPSRVIDHIEIAETNEYNPNNVPDRAWYISDNNYAITYKTHTKYVHVKIVHANGTYTFKTVQPVENSKLFSNLSRILISITIAIFLLYHYGKNFLHLPSKKNTKLS